MILLSILLGRYVPRFDFFRYFFYKAVPAQTSVGGVTAEKRLVFILPDGTAGVVAIVGTEHIRSQQAPLSLADGIDSLYHPPYHRQRCAYCCHTSSHGRNGTYGFHVATPPNFDVVAKFDRFPASHRATMHGRRGEVNLC